MLHFNPENIPNVVLKFIDLHYRKSGHWELLPANKKRQCIEHFLKNAETIPSRYFITTPGFTLGMSIQRAINNYGNPHTVETTPEGKLLSWEFAADPSLAGRQPKEGDRARLRPRPRPGRR